MPAARIEEVRNDVSALAQAVPTARELMQAMANLLHDRMPHNVRHTAVHRLVRAGVPERVAMQLTGHKTRAVFERHNIVSAGDLRDAARRLDSYVAAAV